jgi:hypothetical protein
MTLSVTSNWKAALGRLSDDHVKLKLFSLLRHIFDEGSQVMPLGQQCSPSAQQAPCQRQNYRFNINLSKKPNHFERAATISSRVK